MIASFLVLVAFGSLFLVFPSILINQSPATSDNTKLPSITWGPPTFTISLPLALNTMIICSNGSCSSANFQFNITSIDPTSVFANQFLGVYLDNGLSASNGTRTTLPSQASVHASIANTHVVQGGQLVQPNIPVQPPTTNSPMNDGYGYFVLTPNATATLVVTVSVPSDCSCNGNFHFGLLIYSYVRNGNVCSLCAPSELAQASYQ